MSKSPRTVASLNGLEIFERYGGYTKNTLNNLQEMAKRRTISCGDELSNSSDKFCCILFILFVLGEQSYENS
jgi:hypothetical protein